MAHRLTATTHNLSKLSNWIEEARQGRPQYKADIDGGTRRLKPAELNNLKVLEAYPDSHQATIQKIVKGLEAQRNRIQHELRTMNIVESGGN